MIFKYFCYLYLLSLFFALINFIGQTKIILFILLQIIIIIFFLISRNYKTIFLSFASLYILEFFLIEFNIFHKNLDSFKFKNRNDIIYEASNPIEYLYNKKNKSIYIENKKFIPLSNLSNAKILNGRYNNKLHYLETDDLGFFNTKKDFKYLFLGDSFINYTQINPKNSFINLLNERQIYNMGLTQSGPLTQFSNLKEFISLPKFKNIKKVYWFHSEENDLARSYIKYDNRGGDLKIEFSLTLLRKYLEMPSFKQKLSTNNYEINKEFQKKLKVYNSNKKNKININNFYLINLFKNLKYFINRKITFTHEKILIRKFDEDKKMYSEQLEIYSKILSETIKILEKNKIDLIIIILQDQYNCFYNKKHFLNNKLIQTLKLNKINYFDAYNAFLNDKNCDIKNFNRYGHFSLIGHKNMANYLNKNLF